jgi:SAM-dependent methyltransferase
MTKTTERLIPEHATTREERLLLLRHVFAYEFAKTTIKPGSSVIEVGCGEGYGTSLLAQAASTITGLDVDEETVAHASRKYGSDTVRFRSYDGRTLPFAEGSFDAAVSFQVIEHVRDDASFVDELHKVLKPGGILILTTPNRTYRMRPGRKPWNPFHVREYDASELESLLAGAFAHVAVWGIRGKDEIQAIEHARVAWALRSGPVSAIRRAMPESLRQLVGGAVKAIRGASRQTQDWNTKYGLSDYFVIKTELANSLDLLAVCTG